MPLSGRTIKRDFNVIIALLLVFFGCRQENEQTSGSISQATEPNADDQRIVLTVNGTPFYKTVIDAEIEHQLGRYKDLWPAEFLEQHRQELQEQLVDQMIVNQLLDEEIKAQGIEISDQEVQARIAIKAAEQDPPETVQQYLSECEAHGMNIHSFQEGIRQDLARFVLFERQWNERMDVTEDVIRMHYEALSHKYHSPTWLRASHILIEPESGPGIDPNRAETEARLQAEKCLGLIRSGADFKAVAAAYSDCVSGRWGGDLRYFKKGDMDPAFEKAAFALQPDQVSDIVRTPDGFHLIKVTERQEAVDLSYQEVHEEIKWELIDKRRSEIVEDYCTELREKAHIVYREPNTM